jgi:transposase-like protein
MTKKQLETKYLAIELILEDGMSTSAAAELVGEITETVENWLAEYEEKLRIQEADLIDKNKHMAELQDEIRLRRALYDLVIDHPDRDAEKIASKNWETISDKIKHRIITNAYCIDCGATIITDYVIQGDEECIILYGKCCKCGKSMATSVDL